MTLSGNQREQKNFSDRLQPRRIGKAIIALELAKAGFDVTVHARSRQQEAEQVSKRFKPWAGTAMC